jgi:hypothetical protein
LHLKFKNIRFNQVIKSKKKKYQETKIFINGQPIRARRIDSKTFVIPSEDFDVIQTAMNNVDVNQMMYPITGTSPSNHYMSRFLAKMGLEALASRWLKIDNWNDYLVDYEGFDPIRNFARFPKKGEVWEFSKRRIYEEDSSQVHRGGLGYQVLYEWDILATGTAEASEFYFVIAIFGMEYVINLGGNSIDGYKLWLKNNNNVSPLSNKEYDI